MYLAAEKEEEVSSSRIAARVCRTEAARGQKSLSSNYRAQSHIQIVRFKMVQKLHIYFFRQIEDMRPNVYDVCKVLRCK